MLCAEMQDPFVEILQLTAAILEFLQLCAEWQDPFVDVMIEEEPLNVLTDPYVDVKIEEEQSFEGEGKSFEKQSFDADEKRNSDDRLCI